MLTKRSPIWGCFKVGEDTKFGICNACGQSISRGGKTTKTFNTTNLVYHIRGMHAELHSELLKKCDERTKEKASTPSSSRQLVVATANFISDRSSVSAYIGPILSVIRISAKSYIGATLLKMLNLTHYG